MSHPFVLVACVPVVAREEARVDQIVAERVLPVDVPLTAITVPEPKPAAS